MGLKAYPTPPTTGVEVKWELQPLGWVKLNFDRSRKGPQGRTGADLCIRTDTGKLLVTRAIS